MHSKELPKNLINPNNELFIWGPIPGKPIYISFFMESITHTSPKIYKYQWPPIAFYFEGDTMTLVAEFQKLRDVGKKHLHSYILNDEEFEETK